MWGQTWRQWRYFGRGGCSDQDPEGLGWVRASQGLSRRLHDVWVQWESAGQMGAAGSQSSRDWRSGVCPGVHLEVDWGRLGGGTGMGEQGAVSLKGWQEPLLDCRGGDRGYGGSGPTRHCVTLATRLPTHTLSPKNIQGVGWFSWWLRPPFPVMSLRPYSLSGGPGWEVARGWVRVTLSSCVNSQSLSSTLHLLQ